VIFGDPSAIDDIDRLHWRRFETVIAELFERLGHKTKRVGGKRDHGADVIASRNGTRIAIQARAKTGREKFIEYVCGRFRPPAKRAPPEALGYCC